MAQSEIAGIPAAVTLTIIDGKPTTTSIDIARHFGKRHDAVLRDIRNLLAELPADHAHNFVEMVVETAIGSGATRKDPAYRITRDGFTLLAMGFNGKKALAFKLAYIDAFNRLEAEKLSQAAAPKAIARRAAAPALQAPMQQFSADMRAAIDARAFEITSSALPGVRQWLTEQTKGCIKPDGTPAANFMPTLAYADFAAYSTDFASKNLDTVNKLLQFIHTESGELISKVQAERMRLSKLGNKDAR